MMEWRAEWNRDGTGWMTPNTSSCPSRIHVARSNVHIRVEETKKILRANWQMGGPTNWNMLNSNVYYLYINIVCTYIYIYTLCQYVHTYIYIYMLYICSISGIYPAFFFFQRCDPHLGQFEVIINKVWRLMGIKKGEVRKKKPLTLHYTGCLIGILIIVYYNPHITG